MSQFNEQIRNRRFQDDCDFIDSINGIAGAVTGKRMKEAFSDAEITDAAINAILEYYHEDIKKSLISPEISGLDDRLEYRLRPYGIMRRNVELDEGWYKDAFGPMLAVNKEDESPVALIPNKLFGYSYLDFEKNKTVRINKKNQELFDKSAVCFYPALPLKPLRIRDLLLYMMRQLSTTDIVLFIGTMAVGTIIGLFGPLFTQALFGDVLDSGSKSVLISLGIFMICFAGTKALMNAYQSLIKNRVSSKQEIVVEAAVMSRVMSMPAAFFKKYSSGELSQRANYVQTLCTRLFSSIGTVGLSSVFSLVYIGQIFAFAPSMVIPALVITVLTLVITLLTTFRQMKITRVTMELSAKESGMVYSMITGIRKIKLAGAEKRLFARWARLYTKSAELECNPPLFLKLSPAISLAVSLFGTMVLYYCALASGISVANYYAFNSAYGMVAGAFGSLTGLAATMASIKPILEMASPIMEGVPEISNDKEIITNLSGNIELSHVSFRYSDEMPYVINDLSLTINKGEYLGVVGTTGCGKSTLLRLLLGFEMPERGAIFFDQKDTSRVDLKSLRRQMGVVLQEGKLFAGDIYSNIVISAPQLTVKDAWKAAEMAAIADDIRQMPMGMHTMISEGQGGISGGQKQRIMIARAIAPRPSILLFDEATSALDNITQRQVSDAIDSLNCTRIVIAHRLSTIRHCDRIIVLDKGKIVESGTYEELIDNKGFFAELVARQRI